MEDKILDLIVNQEEISWKEMIFDLVRSEGMNPWDINLTSLSDKYLERLKTYKNLDLKISGKVLLAASMLLHLKSKQLLGSDLDDFDRLLASQQEGADFYDELEQELRQGEKIGLNQEFELTPRYPQPRKRKVSVYDLIQALEKALEVKKRRFGRYELPEMELPGKKFDITKATFGLLSKLSDIFKKVKEVTFSQLIPSNKKEDKVYTFIPLLHLSSEDKINLSQEKNFEEIKITPGGKNGIEQN
ncbi:segregation/condensation protein A [Candidatus Woesearchaeota archaeon]|nr:segregation/condensation protein A [Candidatus Woesearchaeota archaeon]